MLTIKVGLPLTDREEEILRFVLKGAARGYYEQSPGFPLERPREAGLILDLDKAKAELADVRDCGKETLCHGCIACLHIDVREAREETLVERAHANEWLAQKHDAEKALADAREKILSFEKQIADSSASVDGRAPPAPSEAGAEEVVSALRRLTAVADEMVTAGMVYTALPPPPHPGLAGLIASGNRLGGEACAARTLLRKIGAWSDDEMLARALALNAEISAATIPEKQLPNKGDTDQAAQEGLVPHTDSREPGASEKAATQESTETKPAITTQRTLAESSRTPELGGAGPASIHNGKPCIAPDCVETEPCRYHATVPRDIRAEWKRARGKRGVPSNAAARSALKEPSHV